jgi:Ni,Fe-hydrogenase III large subunit
MKKSLENKRIKEIRAQISLIEQENNPSDCNLVLSIKHENSKSHPELQAVDLISGSIFQEMERGNKIYTDLIKKNNEIRGRINRPQEK